jgi:hypothetical protein
VLVSTYTFSVNIPPKIGPNTELNALASPKMLMKIGRFRKGTSGSMIILPPEKMPAAPAPAIARPLMKAVELGAAPQIAEPISKTTIDRRNTHFVE